MSIDFEDLEISLKLPVENHSICCQIILEDDLFVQYYDEVNDVETHFEDLDYQLRFPFNRRNQMKRF